MRCHHALHQSASISTPHNIKPSMLNFIYTKYIYNLFV